MCLGECELEEWEAVDDGFVVGAARYGCDLLDEAIFRLLVNTWTLGRLVLALTWCVWDPGLLSFCTMIVSLANLIVVKLSVHFKRPSKSIVDDHSDR